VAWGSGGALGVKITLVTEDAWKQGGGIFHALGCRREPFVLVKWPTLDAVRLHLSSRLGKLAHLGMVDTPSFQGSGRFWLCPMDW